MKILLLRFSSLGDVILTMPVAMALKKQFSDADIDLGTKLEYKGLFTSASPFGNVIYLEDSGIIPFIKAVNEQGYDMIADLHASLRTSIMLPFLKARVKKRYKKGAFARRVFVKTGIRLSAFQSVLRRYLSPFDITEIPEPPWFTIGEEERQKGGIILKDAGVHKDRIIGVAPGAKWDTKKWGIDRYVELARRLEDMAYDIVFVFGKGDEKDKEVLLNMSTDFKTLNTSDYTLRDTAYAISSMNAFISSDTGLMHLAEAAGTPLVTMFGPTTKEFGFFPTGHKSIVIEKKLVCRPCSLHGTEKCKEGHHKCMEDITIEDVESAVLRLLGDVPISNNARMV
jgi:heptosyltransferase-2